MLTRTCTGSLARKATTLSKPLASLKFPPITSISSSSTRSKDWDDVLTAHADEMCVRSWTVLNKRVGKHTFNSAESSKRKAPSGVVKVCQLPSSFSSTLIFYVVCLCYCLWKFWSCGLFSWKDTHVEHAIWVETKVVQGWTLPSGCN